MKNVQCLDFSDQIFYIGLDVHLKSWKVSILTEQLEHKTYSMDPDPKQLSKYLHRNFPGGNYIAAYESGFSGFSTQKQLELLGVSCIVANAADIPSSDKEKRHKNDRNDSRKIAKSLRAGQLEPIYVSDDEVLFDRSLIRHRSQIVKDITRVKLRIKSSLRFNGIAIPTLYQNNRWSKSFLNWLGTCPEIFGSLRITIDSHMQQLKTLIEQLTKVNHQFKKLSESSRYKEDVCLLMSIPGIGLTSAMIWSTELIDIHRFKKFDNLCGYVGLVPGERSSGDKQFMTHLDRRGNKNLRTLLIENSWIAVRKDPSLMKIYHSYSIRMDKNKAIVRIARKVLNRIRFILVNRTMYQTGIN